MDILLQLDIIYDLDDSKCHLFKAQDMILDRSELKIIICSITFNSGGDAI